MTAARNIYSPRQAEPRGARLDLRFTRQELQDIDDLAARYRLARRLERAPSKTRLIRQALQAFERAYPATSLVIKAQMLFAPLRHAA